MDISSLASNCSPSWQECTALKCITARLPSQFQHGFQTSDLVLTSVSSFEDHLVLGTNVGLIYLAHLPSLHIVRLKCENPLNPITCISAIQSVDDLIAAGSADGCITVFLRHRELAAQHGKHTREGASPNLERFSVSSLHKSAITSLAWSSNGLRVLSGDAEGVVGMLEVDYDTCQCVGRHLLTEAAPVVQLSYWKQAVAVSTTERCLIYSLQTGSVTPVGSKARKCSGKYGAAWSRCSVSTPTPQASGNMPQELDNAEAAVAASPVQSVGFTLYTARPGQRVWLADNGGTVLTTTLIKDIPHDRRIHIVDNQYDAMDSMHTALRFESISVLDTGQLVMHSSDSLVIFNPSTSLVEGFLFQENFIMDVSLSGDCIFILSKDCQLFCLSSKPIDIGVNTINMNNIPVFSDPLVSPAYLKKFGNKLFQQGTSILDNMAKIGGAIASKVTDNSTGSIITGYTEDIKDNYSRNVTSELNSVTKQQIVTDPDHLHTTNDVCSVRRALLQNELQVDKSSNSVPSSPLVTRGKVRPRPKRKGTCSVSPTSMSCGNGLAPAVSKMVEGSSEDTTPKASPVQDNKELVTTESLRNPWDTMSEDERRLREMFDIEYLKNSGADENTVQQDIVQDNCVESLKFSCSTESYETSDGPVILSDNRSVTNLSNDAVEDASNSSAESHCAETTRGIQAATIGNRTSLDSNSSRSLCYGPPSGSSVPSLQSHGSLCNGRPVPDSSSVVQDNCDWVALVLEQAGASHASSLNETNDNCYYSDSENTVPDQVVDGDWMVMDVPSDIKHMCASDNSLILLDSGNCLYIGKVDQMNNSCSWQKAKLPLVASSVSVSSSGKTIWLLSNDSIYECCRLENIETNDNVLSSHKQINGHDLLQRTDDVSISQCNKKTLEGAEHGIGNSYVLHNKPAATGVMQFVCTDDLLFYIKRDFKVYCQRRDCLGEVSLDSDGYSFVSLSCRGGLLWAVDGAGRVLFRIGQSESSPMGHAWGVMKDESNLLDCIPEGTATDDDTTADQHTPEATQTSPRHSFHNNNSFCMIEHCVDATTGSDQRENYVEKIAYNYDDAYESGLNRILHDTSNNNCPTHSSETASGESSNTISRNSSSPNTRHSSVSESADDAASRDAVASIDASRDAVADMTSVPHGAVTTSTVCVGSGGIGWRLTDAGSVQFRPGVSLSIPQGANTHWWQIASKDTLLRSSSGTGAAVLASTKALLWVAETGGSSVALHSTSCKGSVWRPLGTDHWSTVSAEALYASHGSLACLSPNGHVMMVNPVSATALPLPLPDSSPAVRVCQRPEVLWLLTAAGELWLRAGLSATAMLGTHWQQLDLHQINDVHLCHLSLGTEVAWAVDTRGGVYMREGPITPPQPDAPPQAWLQVDRTVLPHSASFTKVMVGPDRQMVWALDSNQRVYVRVAIFHELPIGVAWEQVPGVRLLDLSISECGGVYGLTVSGAVYRREGVAPPANYVGTRWVQVPGALARLSVSVDDKLWGLSERGRLCHHQSLDSLQWRRGFEQDEDSEQLASRGVSLEHWEVV